MERRRGNRVQEDKLVFNQKVFFISLGKDRRDIGEYVNWFQVIKLCNFFQYLAYRINIIINYKEVYVLSK